MKLYLVGDRFIAQLDEEDMKEIEKKTSGIDRETPVRYIRKLFGGSKPPQAPEPRLTDISQDSVNKYVPMYIMTAAAFITFYIFTFLR